LGTLLVPAIAPAQGVLININEGDHVVLPRPPIIIARPWPRPQPEQSSYKIKQLEVDVKLDGQMAHVQATQSFVNTGSRPMEVCFVFPLPYDGAVDQLTLLIDGKECPAKLLDSSDARRMYEDIVRKNQDPALLEWMGTGLFKTSVFPVPPGGERKVTLHYSQLCRQWDGLTDFVFPLSTAKYTSQPVEEVKFQAAIESDAEIKNIYSPSHAVDIKRPDVKHAVISYAAKNIVPTDDFRLFYDVGKGLVDARVISYKPDANEDGYFLLLASPQIKADDAAATKKTVVLAIDRSGSMSGEKIEQAKAAAKFVINHLHEGDLLNLIAYDSNVESWRPELQKFDDNSRKAALGFIEGIYAGGSTNINGALGTALSQLHDANRPNFVIFLTDGIPTVGETNESKIISNAKSNNTVHARIFDFGVGYDVNSRLLDKLARENFGLTEYVRPNENIETAVAALYGRIGSPVMTGVKLNVDVEGAKPEEGAVVNRVYPKEVFDLFVGEQLVLVGRYKKSGAAKITITGQVADGDKQEQKFYFPASLVEHSGDESQAFIEKLWAVRRVGEILDEIDLKGRNDELVKELVSLSLKHGIITPYTSFLADESKRRDLAFGTRAANERLKELDRYADGEQGVEQRVAKHALQAVNQPAAATPMGLGYGGGAGAANRGTDGGRFGNSNGTITAAPGVTGATSALETEKFYAVVSDSKNDADKVVQNVCQIGRKTFFRRGDRWIDSAVTPELEKTIVKIKRFSPEYFQLVDQHGHDVGKYLTLDQPITLELNGKVYEIDADDNK
ncbi:MAG TPA: VIT and VWA domain-containing protein, partial [Pirellulales bacterium]|nr:VIT and VWA domain-containing protein [Pirellulales bacterium]